jgi:hypothetical protein
MNDQVADDWSGDEAREGENVGKSVNVLVRREKGREGCFPVGKEVWGQRGS